MQAASIEPGGAMLLRALRDLQPTSLLAVSYEPLEAVARYCSEKPECREVAIAPTDGRISLPDPSRFDLGAVAGVVEKLADREAAQLLAALRDVYCSSVLVVVAAGHWPLSAYLALGLELRDTSREPAGALDLFWFDVDHYNPEREWNNAENWANPENFKRYRW